jgi:diguanylate cyclase (GGDEF)-like protein
VSSGILTAADLLLLRLTRQAATVPVADLGSYEDDVDCALEGKPAWLYFPARLEQLFEYETQQERSSHLVGVGILWIALGLFVALILPSGSNPTPFGMNPAVRVGVVTPILTVIVFAVWWGVRPFTRELLITLACIVAPASLIVGVMLHPGSDLGTNRGALTIILLFITVVVRLRFWFAAVACLALVALQLGLPLAFHVSVPGNGVLSLVTIAAALTANYTLEREFRVNYLQRLHGRIQGAQLVAMVEQLHDLSQRDPLTGLANRRALDTLLDELGARHEKFAVIIVDIDGFKAFNDCYGHQVGDDALRRVAAMLRASLRFTTDSIARMGGEEFAVVLPETDVEDARTMAERMRKAILELQIPHVQAPTGSVISISAGVSASAGNQSSADVVDEADKALYRAKVAGRNRVEVAGANPASRMAIPA